MTRKNNKSKAVAISNLLGVIFIPQPFKLSTKLEKSQFLDFVCLTINISKNESS